MHPGRAQNKFNMKDIDLCIINHTSENMRFDSLASLFQDAKDIDAEIAVAAKAPQFGAIKLPALSLILNQENVKFSRVVVDISTEFHKLYREFLQGNNGI